MGSGVCSCAGAWWCDKLIIHTLTYQLSRHNSSMASVASLLCLLSVASAAAVLPSSEGTLQVDTSHPRHPKIQVRALSSGVPQHVVSFIASGENSTTTVENKTVVKAAPNASVLAAAAANATAEHSNATDNKTPKQDAGVEQPAKVDGFSTAQPKQLLVDEGRTNKDTQKDLNQNVPEKAMAQGAPLASKPPENGKQNDVQLMPHEEPKNQLTQKPQNVDRSVASLLSGMDSAPAAPANHEPGTGGEAGSEAGVVTLSASSENPPDKMVYFVTAMFNRGPLFDITVESMAKLAQADPNTFWIIVDYGTPGRDVKTQLNEMGMKHEYILKENERFSRTLGLQAALEEVPNDDALVMALDLVSVPVDFAHHVRRNIRKGQTVYAPVMFKLYPGQPMTSRDGEDYTWSWGLLGFVKRDAMQFGGFIGANKGKIDLYKWGCEDVFLADKFGEFGFVAVRGVIKDLVHYTLTDFEKSNLSKQLPESQRWKEYASGRNNECMVNNNDDGRQKNVGIDEYREG